MIAELFSLPVIIAVVALVVFFYWGLGSRPANAPPGPTGVPFLGYAPFLGEAPWVTFAGLKEKYGNVMSIFLGKSYTVILQDYESIRTAYIDQDDIFAGRGEQFLSNYFASGKDGQIHGLIALEGQKWQATKNFITQTIGEFMANSRFEEICLEEIEYLCVEIKKEQGKGFDIHPKVYPAMWNMIGQLLYNRRMDLEEFNFFTNEITVLFEALAGGILQLFPWTRHFPGQRQKWGAITRTLEKQWELFEKELDRHEQTYSDSKVRDFMDVYFRYLASGDRKDSLIMQSKEDLICTIDEMLSAGPEATSASIQWALLYLCYYPDCMKKVQEEIDREICRDRQVMLKDKPNIPYTVATWYECFRLGGNSTVGVMRSTLEDTELNGYHIPKRSFVLPNIYATHRDPRHFPDPDTFKPERFLGTDGQVHLPPQFILWSLGKRACPGQELSRTMTFLVFANLLQRFDVRPCRGQSLAPLDRWIPGISARTFPYQIEMAPRANEEIY